MKLLPVLFISILLVSLFVTTDAARDRKKKKQQARQEEQDEQQDDRDTLLTADQKNEKGQDTRERVHALVERQEDAKKEKEESSSEEKDEKEEPNKNSTEIVIPSRFRRSDMQTLKATKEINDGAIIPVDKKPTQENYAPKNRFRRSDMQTLKSTKEINDGLVIPVDKRPTQENYETKPKTRRSIAQDKAATKRSISSNKDDQSAENKAARLRLRRNKALLKQIEEIDDGVMLPVF